MQRREFIRLLGGAAVAWPLAARAQRPAMPTIGYLHGGSPESNEHRIAAFRRGLNETGYVEGENVAIEFRWAHNQSDRLPELAADLVRRQMVVIVTPGSTPSAHAAKAATSTIPIVFGIGGDPVNDGLVQSLARPGGNVTGIAFLTVELEAKRLGLLHELLPTATRVAHLVNPSNPLYTAPLVADVQRAASSIGMQIEFVSVTNKSEIDLAFANIAQKRTNALLIAGDALMYGRRLQIAMLAARHAVATLYPNRDFCDAGGLMSYGPDTTDMIRQVGIYAGRILKGEKPADLPIMQASKFELVINLQTAKTIGVEVPAMLLARADEVIE
jgi:putative tryptophan/tyrosine transport system substrate-binding protein